MTADGLWLLCVWFGRSSPRVSAGVSEDSSRVQDYRARIRCPRSRLCHIKNPRGAQTFAVVLQGDKQIYLDTSLIIRTQFHVPSSQFKTVWFWLVQLRCFLHRNIQTEALTASCLKTDARVRVSSPHLNSLCCLFVCFRRRPSSLLDKQTLSHNHDDFNHLLFMHTLIRSCVTDILAVWVSSQFAIKKAGQLKALLQ